VSREKLEVEGQSQSAVFLKSEGDQWFNRNSGALGSSREGFEIECVQRILSPFKKGITNILEVGSSSGVKL